MVVEKAHGLETPETEPLWKAAERAPEEQADCRLLITVAATAAASVKDDEEEEEAGETKSSGLNVAAKAMSRADDASCRC